ncbi:MAG: peptidase M19, partial [Kordiimonas sp.]
MTDEDRRKFLTMAAAGLVAAPMTVSIPAFASGAKKWPGLEKSLVLNNLGGISNPNSRGRPSNPFTIDKRALKDALASGLTMTNTTIGYVAGPMEPFEHSV